MALTTGSSSSVLWTAGESWIGVTEKLGIRMNSCWGMNLFVLQPWPYHTVLGLEIWHGRMLQGSKSRPYMSNWIIQSKQNLFCSLEGLIRVLTRGRMGSHLANVNADHCYSPNLYALYSRTILVRNSSLNILHIAVSSGVQQVGTLKH